MNLVDILEGEFGEIKTGLKVVGFPDVQIVKHHSDDNHRLSTLGLHRYVWGDAKVGFEWCAQFEKGLSADRMASAIDYSVQCVLSGTSALPKRGTWLNLPKTIWQEFDSEALYFTSMPLSSDAEEYCVSENLVIARLIAISQDEIELIELKGWQELESRWASRDETRQRY